MGFNVEKFMATNFEPNTREYPVPQLALWFDEGEKAIWKIKALSGAELGNADEASRQKGALEAIVNALTSVSSKDVKKEVERLIGHTKEKPESIAKRMYHLHYGTIWDGPEERVPFEVVRKICDEFSILFLELTNAVLILSGEGNIPEKKSMPSGKTKK